MTGLWGFGLLCKPDQQTWEAPCVECKGWKRVPQRTHKQKCTHLDYNESPSSRRQMGYAKLGGKGRKCITVVCWSPWLYLSFTFSSQFSESAILDIIASYLVLPNRMCFPLVDQVKVEQMRFPLPRVRLSFLIQNTAYVHFLLMKLKYLVQANRICLCGPRKLESWWGRKHSIGC